MIIVTTIKINITVPDGTELPDTIEAWDESGIDTAIEELEMSCLHMAQATARNPILARFDAKAEVANG